MTILDSMLKSRDITLPTTVYPVKAMIFQVVTYECESWTIKKAEHWETDAFELWCWRRLLRVPWTARGSNQSILKEISPEYSLEGLMLKVKLQYLANRCEELTHLKRPWCWERLKVGGEGDDTGWDGWMTSPTPGAYSNYLRWVGDAIQSSHSLSSPSPPAFILSQHQGLFQWVSSLHQVASASTSVPPMNTQD